ncbi:MAG: hypothetical protein WCJ01_11360 [Ignavibacteria bacterium]
MINNPKLFSIIAHDLKGTPHGFWGFTRTMVEEADSFSVEMSTGLGLLLSRKFVEKHGGISMEEMILPVITMESEG